MHRRTFLAATVALVPVTLTRCAAAADEPATPDAGTRAFEITRTEKEWRRLLTPEQFHVLREQAWSGREPAR